MCKACVTKNDVNKKYKRKSFQMNIQSSISYYAYGPESGQKKILPDKQTESRLSLD